MTPLKPIENIQDVIAVPSTRYPRSGICSHPECDRTDVTYHHIFGRPPGEHSDSWFVLLPVNGKAEYGTPVGAMHPKFMAKKAIPHVVGLCGHGTADHHGDVEGHRAWIKYEGGVFVWYERDDLGPNGLGYADMRDAWKRLGPLDPQPFNWGEKKNKPKKRKKGEERQKRDRITIGVPTGFADGGAVWDDLFGNGKDGQPYGRVRERFNALVPAEGGEKPFGDRPPFELIVDMANDWLNS